MAQRPCRPSLGWERVFSGRGRRVWAVLGVMAVLGAGLLAPSPLGAQGKTADNPKLLAALAAENWPQVVKETGSGKNLPPVARLLKAHAYLATNRNNDSLCLFLATLGEMDLKAWDDWTQDYVKKAPGQAAAHYFRGDALARLGQWDQALLALNRALELNPRHALSLNTRGAVQAGRGKWNEALVDFEAATQAAPRLADAFASLGATYVSMHTGDEGALKAFNQAIDLSPKFALAYNGRGCVNVAKGRLQAALNDLKRAAELNQCFDIHLANLAALARLIENITAQRAAKLGPIKPGMSTQATAIVFQNMTPPEQLKALKDMNGHRKWCEFAAGVGDFISAFTQNTSSFLGLKATAPIYGLLVSGEAGKSGSFLFNFKTFGDNLAATSRKDAAYWGTTISQVIVLNPSLAKDMKILPGGITAEDLEHAYVDKGKWLETGYGLAYNVRPQPASPAKKD